METIELRPQVMLFQDGHERDSVLCNIEPDSIIVGQYAEPESSIFCPIVGAYFSPEITQEVIEIFSSAYNQQIFPQIYFYEKFGFINVAIIFYGLKVTEDTIRTVLPGIEIDNKRINDFFQFMIVSQCNCIGEKTTEFFDMIESLGYLDIHILRDSEDGVISLWSKRTHQIIKGVFQSTLFPKLSDH